jgi:hypothetical protein
MHGESQTTNVRTLRTFLERTMSDAEKSLRVPAICVRIRKLREDRKRHWAADHPGDRAIPFAYAEAAQARMEDLGC